MNYEERLDYEERELNAQRAAGCCLGCALAGLVGLAVLVVVLAVLLVVI
jgi:CHASE3 domain sensor protein